MKGKVKWFNENKGYGFILSEDNQEFFVHWQSIVTAKPHVHKTLAPNERVTFDTMDTERGTQAINVIKIDE